MRANNLLFSSQACTYQTAEAVGDDVALVHEDILSSIVRSDEAKSLGGVEPLHGAGGFIEADGGASECARGQDACHLDALQ